MFWAALVCGEAGDTGASGTYWAPDPGRLVVLWKVLAEPKVVTLRQVEF